MSFAYFDGCVVFPFNFQSNKAGVKIPRWACIAHLYFVNNSSFNINQADRDNNHQ